MNLHSKTDPGSSLSPERLTFMLTQKASSLTCVKVRNNKRVLIQGASLKRWSLHFKRKRNQFGNWYIHFKSKKPVWKVVDPILENKKPVLKLVDPFQENKLFLIKNVT